MEGRSDTVLSPDVSIPLEPSSLAMIEAKLVAVERGELHRRAILRDEVFLVFVAVFRVPRRIGFRIGLLIDREALGDVDQGAVVVSGVEPIANVLALAETRDADDPNRSSDAIESRGRFLGLQPSGCVVVLKDEGVEAFQSLDGFLAPRSRCDRRSQEAERGDPVRIFLALTNEGGRMNSLR